MKRASNHVACDGISGRQERAAATRRRLPMNRADTLVRNPSVVFRVRRIYAHSLHPGPAAWYLFTIGVRLSMRKGTGMKKAIIGALLATLFNSCDLLDLSTVDSGGEAGLTSAEVVAGLKEALAVGADSASSRLGATGGYLLNKAVRIALPEDAAAVLSFTDTLDRIMGGWGPAVKLAAQTAFDIDMAVFDMRESLHVAINRAAEKAAPMSGPIFKDAISSITIADGFAILYGDSTAATAYLHAKTYTPLSELYSPFVDSTLALVGAHAMWQSLAINYNALAGQYDALVSVAPETLPALPYDSLTTSIGHYTAGRALDGLFYMVGQEESRIRANPGARVTEILKDVFGKLDT